MSWRLVALLIGAGCCAPRAANAHAPPKATGIAWRGPTSDPRAVVRTNRGLIIEGPKKGSFRIVCNDAFDVALAEVPPVAIAADGRVVLGTYEAGLVRSSPDHCNFESVAGPFADLYPIDVEPDSQGGFYAAVLPRDGSSAELLQSSDDGDRARSLGDLPGAPSALDVAPSDPSRIYVSSTVADGNLSFGRMLSSRDSGQTFAETSVELEASELRVFLLAVDPNEPDRLFLRTQSRDGITLERLLRSNDGGGTFDTVLTAPGPLSAVVQPDGMVWAGGADGLYRSNDGGLSFEGVGTRGPNLVTCLAVRDERLYACGFSAGEFGVLVSEDAGDSFQWFLRFPWVKARLDCPADSDEGLRCADAFLDWSAEQGLDDSDKSPEPSAEDPLRSDGGCHLPRPAPARGGLLATGAGLALALALARRWRRG
jgi:hypothetical protein